MHTRPASEDRDEDARQQDRKKNAESHQQTRNAPSVLEFEPRIQKAETCDDEVAEDRHERRHPHYEPHRLRRLARAEDVHVPELWRRRSTVRLPIERPLGVDVGIDMSAVPDKLSLRGARPLRTGRGIVSQECPRHPDNHHDTCGNQRASPHSAIKHRPRDVPAFGVLEVQQHERAHAHDPQGCGPRVTRGLQDRCHQRQGHKNDAYE
mmetsp:Transcript_109858/g.317614  ORF Transcript_109858/g.317614 Transcript_109858/m.317614 type:complete len:208 (-) Transcript_109858:332-955(-)